MIEVTVINQQISVPVTQPEVTATVEQPVINVTLRALQGPEGIQGPPGATVVGPPGPQGDKGDTGVSQLPFDHKCFFDGQNQLTDQLVYEIKLPAAGYLTGISVVMDDQRTAGDILFRPAKNGTALAATNLNASINASYPLDRAVTIPNGTAGFAFAAGDRLGLIVTSTGFMPLANTANFSLHFTLS